MNTTDDDLPPADPAESLRLIAQGRAAAERRLIPDPRLLLWPWGLAWLIGFGVYFLRFGPGGFLAHGGHARAVGRRAAPRRRSFRCG